MPDVSFDNKVVAMTKIDKVFTALSGLGSAASVVSLLLNSTGQDTQNKKYNKILDELSKLQDGQDAIQSSIKAVTSTVEWSGLTQSGHQAQSQINNNLSLIKKGLGSEERKQKWASRMLGTTPESMEMCLIDLNDLIMYPPPGQGSLDSKNSIIQAFADKVSNDYLADIKGNQGNLKQSPWYLVNEYFKSTINLQVSGMGVWAIAYGIKYKGETTAEDGKYKSLESIIEGFKTDIAKQIDYVKSILEKLDSSYQNNIFDDNTLIKWSGEQGSLRFDFGPINAQASWGAISGVSLYKKPGNYEKGVPPYLTNSIGIKAYYCPVESLLSNVTHIHTEENWKWNKFDPSSYFPDVHDVKRESRSDSIYIDIQPTRVDKGWVATDIMFYQKGNRLALKLKGRELIMKKDGSWKLGEIEREFEKKDPKDNDDEYFSMQHTNWYWHGADDCYVETSSCMPDPCSFVVGVALYEKGNSLAIKVFNNNEVLLPSL